MSKFTYKAVRFGQYARDVDDLFDNAEPYIADVKRDYMYMYSDVNCDYFKHKDTKEYQHAPHATKWLDASR